jgi:CheY-like chemotaxis protein
MAKRVLSVGQCSPDHAAIGRLLKREFGAEVVPADNLDEALAELRGGEFALVLVNRLLDADRSEGMAVIEAIKADPAISAVPVMMVSNYAESQQRAMTAGSVEGFGKSDLASAATKAKLEEFLA